MLHDDGWLLDILLAARRVSEYVSNVSAEEFRQNPMLQDAVVKRLEIIGEAANRLSEEYKAAHPEIPWTLMIGMRHRLVHAYFNIDLPRVWHVAVKDIPDLVCRIELIVPPPGNS